MRTGLPKVYEQLQRAGGGLTDGQLLGRFVAARDEASFAALVRRHGPLVLGVCRRVLRHVHDAEDAFQATFLVLARKAASVARRESVGCWLYAVAYHTAVEAGRRNSRRRAREKQVTDMPHPEVAPAEAPDWLPLLDRELNRLSEKYRKAIVLCDLEGKPRREAARELGVPEGTLSSRLAKARRLLAKRLGGRGLALAGGAVAAAVTANTASAQVPAALVSATTKAAALVAAGQLAAVSTPAVTLMKGVMKVMLVKKLRLLVGVVMVTAAFGAVGFVCRPGDQAQAQTGAAGQPVIGNFTAPDGTGGGKHVSELDALRKENELLKFNLRIVLEKSAAQEKELESMRGRATNTSGGSSTPSTNPHGIQGFQRGSISPAEGDTRPATGTGRNQGGSGTSSSSGPANSGTGSSSGTIWHDPLSNGTTSTGGSTGSSFRGFGSSTASGNPGGGQSSTTSGSVGAASGDPNVVPGAAHDLDSALKALHNAQDKESQQRAADALEIAIKKLRDELKGTNNSPR